MQQVFRCFSKLLPQVMNFSIFSSSYPSFLQHHSAVLWGQGSPQCKYEHFFLFNYYFFSFLIVLEKHAYLNLRERQARLIILMKISVPIFTAWSLFVSEDDINLNRVSTIMPFASHGPVLSMCFPITMCCVLCPLCMSIYKPGSWGICPSLLQMLTCCSTRLKVK